MILPRRIMFVVGLVLFLAGAGAVRPETRTSVIHPEKLSEYPEHPDKSRHSRDLSGRVFFTEQQRRELDRHRNRYQKALAAEKEERAPPTRSLVINGVVVRGDGRNTLWINGEPILEGSAPRENIRAIKRPDNTVQVEFSHGSNNIRMKPGQEIILRGNDILEVR